MNESNPLEKQLESWTPRRPSAKLKQRLFPAAARPVAESSPGIPAWAKFAPAFCVVLLAGFFSLAPHDKPDYLAVSSGSNVLASLSSNLLGFCATNTRSVELNVAEMPAAAITFDWTKGVRSLSTTGSFPLWKTNVQKL